MFRPAIELAGMVRAGEISARELVQISLERIEELNPALNAFVEVDAERALAAADEIGPGRRAPVRGGADRDQEQPPGAGPAPHLRLLADGRLRVRLRPQRHPAPEGRWVRDRRHDDAARVRHPADERGAPLRADPQPVGSRAHPRRLLRRRGGGGGQRHGAGRPRQRRRRLDPHPRRLLRAGRAQAEPRTDLRGPRARRLRAGDRRHAHAHRRRHRGDPRRARRLRAGRRHLGAAAGRAVRAERGTPPARRAAGCGSPRRRCRRPGRGRRPDLRAGRRRCGRAAALARARGRGGRSAVAGGRAEGAVRRGVLQPRRPVDRLLGHRRRARADRGGHGADELGDLLDGPEA